MPYLTKEEYEKMGFAEISEPLSFNNLLLRSSVILDNLTRNYYHHNSLEEDKTLRGKKFKEALGAQIEHFSKTGNLTTDEVANTPASMTVGRTTVSKASRGANVSGVSEKPSIVSNDVYMYLEGTGLLNRGVR